MFQRLISAIVFVLSIYGCLSEPTVVTKSGKIVGHYLTSFGGKKYEAYQGIPYALPPTGERRFKPPVPIKPWSDKLMANRLKSSCWQHERQPFPSGSYVKGDEDCLYLNVFAPDRKIETAFPVLFYLHGGGFQYGSSNPEEESFLMDYKVILVTLEYRLGALGFLSTEDEVVPGNMGLKDQSLALRWVHENIEHFGGNPNKITLFGHSAGSASVQYHYLSPMSAGLFQNGISFSGTVLDWWAHTENSRQKALKLGKLMNCTTSIIKEMVACLRQCPAREITKAQKDLMPWRLNPAVPFGPVVEKFSENSFIDRSPSEILESGQAYDVPWITGVVSEEGIFPMAEYFNDVALKDMNDNWVQVAPLLLGYNDTIPKEDHASLTRIIRKHYFGDKIINKENFMTSVYLVGDRWFVIGAEKAARAQAKANESPVYFFRYTYRANESMSFKHSNSSNYFGVCHGDEVNLFMKNDNMSPTTSSNDMLMMKHLIKALISFANDRSPAVDLKWPRVDATNNLEYLGICGPRCAIMKATDNLGQKKFWSSIGLD